MLQKYYCNFMYSFYFVICFSKKYFSEGKKFFFKSPCTLWFLVVSHSNFHNYLQLNCASQHTIGSCTIEG